MEVGLQFNTSGSKFNTSRSESITNKTSYQRLIGKLIYLIATKPDITFTVNKLSQFMQSPTMAHVLAAQSILKYLHKMAGKGIMFTKSNHLKIEGNSDAD